MSLETGTVLNNIYRVVKLLGKGSMGHVYLVEKIEDDKKFVVKELVFQEQAGLDLSTAKKIFFREAEFMTKFNHPGLPKNYGFFSQNTGDYIVMDYIEGKTLEEIITSTAEPVNEKSALDWTIELAEILNYLHNSFHKPIVYRDLKPSNIIIKPNGKPVLVDFGIARYYNPDKDSDTFNYGSPGYAPPEQYKGRGQSTPQTDVFSLGVILYQMLTKYDPTIKPLTFPPIKNLNPFIFTDLENIIKRALELNPVKRYISVEEFKENLEKYSGKKKDRETKVPDDNADRGFFTGERIFSLSIGLSLLTILLIIIIPQFLRARAQGLYESCDKNQKNIATSLEMYATDNYGGYPTTLDQLTEKGSGGGAYMKTIPVCPSSHLSYEYSYGVNPDNFTASCQGTAHTAAGISGGGYPQYSPGQGLSISH